MDLYRSVIRICAFFAAFLAVTAGAAFPASAENSGKSEITITYFYFNACAACNEEGKFIDMFNRLTEGKKAGAQLNFRFYNTFRSSGSEALKEYIEKYKLPEDKQAVPLLFINDRFFSGEGAIEKGLKECFTGEEARSSTSMVIYFYVSSCSECESVKGVLDGLEHQYTVGVSGKEAVTGLEIKRYDIGKPENLERIKKYFTAYRVAEADQEVPILFLRDRYLSGEDEIKRNLANDLRNGEGLGVSEIRAEGGEPGGELLSLSGYELAGAFLTGLVNGLNPCSLSMLLFFISMLLVRNVDVLKFGLSFIAGKFIAYFLLGTVLFHLLAELDGAWFRSVQGVTKTALLAVVLLLAFLNIRDFFAARSERYGKIVLQLPAALRKANHNWIKRITAIENIRLLLLLSFVLGMMISAGEFLCTGQIYLATILYALKRSPAFNTQTAAYFLIYGIALVIPLLALTFGIQKGREIFDVSEAVRAKMPVIKLISGLVFIGFAVLLAVGF
jgi:cytochrome c biogenesis protein CcdA/glutaredoxin